MKSNQPLHKLIPGEEVSAVLLITSVQWGRTRQGRPFYDARGRNSTGSITLRVWADVMERIGVLKPGLWEVTGRVEVFQSAPLLVLSSYNISTLDTYRRNHGDDPPAPKAF